jgi:hypothetical protein
MRQEWQNMIKHQIRPWNELDGDDGVFLVGELTGRWEDRGNPSILVSTRRWRCR